MGNLEVWLLVVNCLCVIHQGDPTRAATCCKYDTGAHKTYSCKGCGLNAVPTGISKDVHTLDLSHNNLTIIKDSVFVEFTQLTRLHLNNNQLHQLNKRAFKGLRSLKELDLRQNQLCLTDDNLSGVFNITEHLKILQLANNNCSKNITEYLGIALKPLRELRQLSLPFVKGTDLNQAFRELTSLKYLMLLGSSTGINTNGGTLGCDMFKALKSISLEMLSIRNAGVDWICPGVLHCLKKLKYFNVACNRQMFFSNVVQVVNNLPNATLNTLIADGVGAGKSSIEVFRLQFKHAWQNLKDLSLRFLNTAHINLGSLRILYAMPELRYAGLAGNMPWIYLGTGADIMNVINFTKIETVDMSYYGGSSYSEKQFYQDYCEPDNIHDEPHMFFRRPPNEIVIPDTPRKASSLAGHFLVRNLPMTLRYLYLDFFSFAMLSIFNYKLSKSNQVLVFNISNSNLFGRFTSFEQAKDLQVLDASNCRFNFLDPRPLQYPNLSTLVLRDNKFVNIGSEHHRLATFARLKKLRHLDLSGNKIKYIKQTAFSHLPKVQEIRLQRNDLSDLDMDFNGSLELKFLDVSQNYITSVSDRFTQSLDEIAVENEVQLDLSGNLLICSCDSLTFLKWFKQTKVKFLNKRSMTCHDGQTIVNLNGINLSTKVVRCYMTRTHLSVVLSTLIPTAFIVITIGQVYKKRSKIEFYYYVMKDRLLRRRAQNAVVSDSEDVQIIDQDLAKNVFISCSGQDTHWLHEEVIPRLEEEWHYTTFSVERDMDMGVGRAHSAVAINFASVCMCVISPNFCNDQVCEWELEMILAKGEDSVLILYKERIDPTKHGYIYRITKFYNHIEYGESDLERQKCWDKLRSYLQQKIHD